MSSASCISKSVCRRYILWTKSVCRLFYIKIKASVDCLQKRVSAPDKRTTLYIFLLLGSFKMFVKNFNYLTKDWLFLGREGPLDFSQFKNLKKQQYFSPFIRAPISAHEPFTKASIERMTIVLNILNATALLGPCLASKKTA